MGYSPLLVMAIEYRFHMQKILSPFQSLRELPEVIIRRVGLWKLAISQRVASIPAWVIVLTVAGVVGSISAMVSVMGLARWQNRDVPELEIPVESEVEGGS